ncbi:hypothetical protein K8R03_01460 [Candidatus Kaiserbacteria bacterium]|nr:hypothetical protein [Candidatus Kaiserbacteria bacterium]
MPGKKKPAGPKSHLDVLCDKRMQQTIDTKVLTIRREEERRDFALRQFAKTVEKMTRRQLKIKRNGFADKRIARFSLDVAIKALAVLTD